MTLQRHNDWLNKDLATGLTSADLLPPEIIDRQEIPADSQVTED